MAGQGRVWLGAGWCFSSGAPFPTHLFSSSRGGMKNGLWSHYEKASPATQRVLPHRSEVPLWVPFTALCPCPPQQTLDLVLVLREEAAIVSCIGDRIVQGGRRHRRAHPSLRHLLAAQVVCGARRRESHNASERTGERHGQGEVHLRAKERTLEETQQGSVLSCKGRPAALCCEAVRWGHRPP